MGAPPELIGVKRHDPGCGPEGKHWVPAPGPRETTFCPCRTVARIGPNPDRYCLRTCFCGSCPHWVPLQPINYRAVVARMQQEQREKEERRRAAQRRLAGRRS